MGCVLDVSQEMFNSDLLGFGGSDGGWDVDELAVDVAFGVGFLLGEIGLGGKRDLLLVLDSYNDKYWVGVVSTKDFVDLNV